VKNWSMSRLLTACFLMFKYSNQCLAHSKLWGHLQNKRCIYQKKSKQFFKQQYQVHNQGVHPGNCSWPKFSKTCLVVRYNIKLQSFCYPPKISVGCSPEQNEYLCKQQNSLDQSWMNMLVKRLFSIPLFK